MSVKSTFASILLAEDNDDEYALIAEAFRKARLHQRLVRFKNGEELLDYLLARGAYEGRVIDKNVPCIVILDVDMPVMNGKKTLKRIKEHAALRKLPVIILTSSARPQDIEEIYDLGAASFIRKPLTFDAFIDVVNAFGHYWLSIVELPPANGLPNPMPRETGRDERPAPRVVES